MVGVRVHNKKGEVQEFSFIPARPLQVTTVCEKYFAEAAKDIDFFNACAQHVSYMSNLTIQSVSLECQGIRHIYFNAAVPSN